MEHRPRIDLQRQWVGNVHDHDLQRRRVGVSFINTIVKLTLGSIKAAEAPLKKILNAELPVAMAFKLSKLVKVFDAELIHYELQRVKLVEKLGEKDGDGNTTVKPENIEAFMAEMEKLHAIECELPGDPIAVADLAEVRMSAVDLSLLDGVVQ